VNDEDRTPLFIEWLQSLDLRKIRNLDELETAIAVQIGEIEQQMVLIVRQVLQNPRFQQLESSYRSIYKLIQSASSSEHDVRNMPATRRVNVFVLDVSAEELQLDLVANSYRQTWIYDKLFRKRFDFLIGEQNIDLENYSAVYPFSLMIVDFDFGLDDTQKSELEKFSQIDLGALRKLAKIGEECFCMFLMSLSPNFFGKSIHNFSQLENVIDVKSILKRPRYNAWNEFRQQDYSRMIGITLPRVLVRKPYRNYHMSGSVNDDGSRSVPTGISFSEVDGFGDNESMLWGRSSFAVAQTMLRSFKQYDWFSDVSGVDRDAKTLATSDEPGEPGYDGGLIDGLPLTYFNTDARSVANYAPTEIVISEKDEAIYSSIGFIPLFSINQSPFVATLSCQSVQGNKEMGTVDATNNLRLSTMFNYMLCVCRMAHRLKIECRTQIGKSVGPEEIQDHMQQWLMEHSSGQNRGFEQKMVKPFFDENTGFFVYEDVTDPGRYDCTIRLCPHHKYDSGKTRVILEPVTLQMQVKANEDGE
jgi:type VI secretion system ImpC/EvpB family protein